MCIYRPQNRNCTDLKPNSNGYKTAHLPLLNHTCLKVFLVLLRISELLCRKSHFTVSMSVVGWWPGSSLHGCMLVLPDYRAHRGLLSSGLWNKCEQTERSLCCLSSMTIESDRVRFMSGNSAVEVPCRCGFLGDIHIANLCHIRAAFITFRIVFLM